MTNEDLVEISDQIAQLYEEEILDDLNTLREEIIQVLKTTFEQYDERFKLRFSNSVYKNKKVYSVVSRLKEKESLYEKLHRKNLIFPLIEQFSIKTVKDFQNIKESLKIVIKNQFDDNIGCRILCDLQTDVKNSFDLIRNHYGDFHGIEFKNLRDQPKFKKNGLEIFKIECVYKEVPFELQIKSKIESAWDDLEHDMYYKDHHIDVVKAINNKALIHVGLLLKQLDVFMCDIRHMNNGEVTYKDQEKLEQIEQRYQNDIQTLIRDYTFNFSNIAKQLLFLFPDDLTSLGQSHFYEKLSNIISNRERRHDAWELMILEAVYNDAVPKTPNSISFKDKYFHFICQEIRLLENFRTALKQVYEHCFDQLAGSKHMLSIDQYVNLYELYKGIQEVYIELEEEERCGEVELDSILVFVGMKFFSLPYGNQSDEEKCLAQIKDHRLFQKENMAKIMGELV